MFPLGLRRTYLGGLTRVSRNLYGLVTFKGPEIRPLVIGKPASLPWIKFLQKRQASGSPALFRSQQLLPSTLLLGVNTARAFTTHSANPQKASHDKEPEPTASKITKANLLSEANNTFSRTLVHIKWPLLRGNRNTSALDITSAFISWLVMGNLLWIILGTTTFGLVAMYCIHYLDNLWYKFSQLEDEENTNDNSVLGTLTSMVLAHGLGMKIEFQKGNILPELREGKLRFRNFTVSSSVGQDEEEDKMYQFSAKVEAMDITLSFKKWYEGNGLINDMEIFGLHGEVFKSERLNTTDNIHESIHFQYDVNDYNLEALSVPPQPQAKVKSFLDSDYQLDHLKIRDSYFEIFSDSSKSNVPLRVTIFSCDLPQLRGDRVLIDFFNANNVSGALNDSMFTIHKRQNVTNYGDTQEINENKIVRCKINGINLGAISKSNPNLKFNWLVNGSAEITADITIPNLNEEEFQFVNEYRRVSNALSSIVSDFVSVTNPEPESKDNGDLSESNTLLQGALAAIYHTFSKPTNDRTPGKSNYVMVNVKIKFSDLKASLPQHLPYSSTGVPFISLQNLRSLIACINTLYTGSPTLDNSSSSSPSPTKITFNAHNPLIIKTTVIEKVTDLYNIDNLGQTKIVDSIISDVYEDLLKLVKANERNIISERSNLWSHSIASQLLLLGLGVIV
ncbi:uncharacterized protein CANTADRAFT_25525 [Suhomyces tanzawaensis NRRL Y-17324]|uniref:Uncharacterized protein n=1 Tax=Suhomyces tanzawaensis NRRL Y-17324 TaxID=984487 RepID=A0A1E4SJG3_9ASCO|nr:uncharacterized protein CANTADRAFT_25525 [Suhomyces tanzawaensis NRRL Y-17324]ODV79577.1 hypothetical protein CANTADRAFT_25525 [Suhomyces tanzawaensis NRRL Y-17324]